MYIFACYFSYGRLPNKWTNIFKTMLSYDDAFDMAEYAIPAMQYVVGSGVIAGKSTSTLNPKDNLARAEIAVILKRFVEKTKTK